MLLPLRRRAADTLRHAAIFAACDTLLPLAATTMLLMRRDLHALRHVDMREDAAVRDTSQYTSTVVVTSLKRVVKCHGIRHTAARYDAACAVSAFMMPLMLRRLIRHVTRLMAMIYVTPP